MDQNKALYDWVYKLGKSELPVLKHTASDLAMLREDDNKLSAQAISGVIRRDPIMTVKLLRYLQNHKHRSQTSDVIQVEQALLMLGMEPFFNNVAARPLIQDMLKSHPLALPPVLRVIHRSHRASSYAFDWAVQLRDMHFEEVRIAALLHDLAEILMWCFAPEEMLAIYTMQKQDRALRSHDVQTQVLGFSLHDLQKVLAVEWELPGLLQNDAGVLQSRRRIVDLAINLARHSANGWDDAALPDDYKDVAELLHITDEEARTMFMVEAGRACDLTQPH